MQAVEGLLCKCEAPSSNPQSHKKKKRKKERNGKNFYMSLRKLKMAPFKRSKLSRPKEEEEELFLTSFGRTQSKDCGQISPSTTQGLCLVGCLHLTAFDKVHFMSSCPLGTELVYNSETNVEMK
jgi:hypothetical protein